MIIYCNPSRFNFEQIGTHILSDVHVFVCSANTCQYDTHFIQGVKLFMLISIPSIQRKCHCFQSSFALGKLKRPNS